MLIHSIAEQRLFSRGFNPGMPVPPSASSTSFLLYNPGTERAHTVFRIAGNVGDGMLIRNLTTGQRCQVVDLTDASLQPGAYLELGSRVDQTRIVLDDSRELVFAIKSGETALSRNSASLRRMPAVFR